MEKTDVNSGSFDLFSLQLTAVGNKSMILWWLRWLVNTMTNVHILYKDTPSSACTVFDNILLAGGAPVTVSVSSSHTTFNVEYY